jgi:NADH:ubiquinone oxidoreductase subunit 2 (subunit N)
MRELLSVLPEGTIIVGMGALLIGEITYHGERWRLMSWTSLLGLSAALIQTVLAYRLVPGQILANTYSIDGFAIFFKILAIVSAMVTLCGIFWMNEMRQSLKVEAAVLIMAVCLGVMLTAAAVDLLVGLFGVILVNTASSLLVGFHKDRISSADAATKHWYQTVFVGIFLSFGSAILFRYSGSLNIYEIQAAIVSKTIPGSAAALSFALLAMGITYQIAAFPFGMATVDVVAGAPTPVGGYLLSAGRLAGFGLGIRFLISLFATQNSQGGWSSILDHQWNLVLAVIASLSSLFGGLLSLVQTSVKRLLCFLIMVETGYLLTGVAVMDRVGVNALLFSLIPHMICSLGAFGALTFFRDREGSDRFEDLKEVLLRYPFQTTLFCIFLLGLVGLPPLPGFLGRFVLWESAMRNQLPVLFLVGLISWVLSLIAAFRLLFILIGGESKVNRVLTPELAVDSTGLSGTHQLQRGAYLVVLLLPVGIVIYFAEAVVSWAGRSLGFTFW